MPQERDYLTRASEAYQQALDLYAGVPRSAACPPSVRRTQAGLERVKGRLEELDGSTFGFDLGPLGSVTFQRNADDKRRQERQGRQPPARTIRSSDRMAVTYTRRVAARYRASRARVRRRSTRRAWCSSRPRSWRCWRVVLAYEGRVQRLAMPGGAQPAATINLSTATTAAALETALEPALSAPADRRLAARRACSRSWPRHAKPARCCPTWAPSCAPTVPAALVERTPGVDGLRGTPAAGARGAAARGAAGPPSGSPCSRRRSRAGEAGARRCARVAEFRPARAALGGALHRRLLRGACWSGA